MKQFVFVVGLFLASASVVAEDQCASWGCKSTISTLYTNVEGVIYVGTPFDEKLANCTAVSNIYFTLNPNSGNSKEVYASLLAAFMAEKTITLRIKEGHSKCELAYVSLESSK